MMKIFICCLFIDLNSNAFNIARLCKILCSPYSLCKIQPIAYSVCEIFVIALVEECLRGSRRC